MRIEKRILINLIVFFLLLFISAYSVTYAQDIEDAILASEEITLVEETDEGIDSNSESNIELTTFPNPIFIGPIFIPSPFFFPGPFFFPRFIVAHVFVNPFFFSFGFSFFTDPFFFSFGFPFFFNCPFFFSPFAFNSFVYFPHHHHHRYHHAHRIVHDKPSKIVKTGVPINEPVINHVNNGIGSTQNLQNQLKAPGALKTNINPTVDNNSVINKTDFATERARKRSLPGNNSTFKFGSKVDNNETGFRLFGGQGHTISSNSGSSNSITLENRMHSYNPTMDSRGKLRSFRDDTSTNTNNRNDNSMSSNSPFKKNHRSQIGTSNFSSKFRSHSFDRIGRTSIGKMGGSFRGFRRR